MRELLFSDNQRTLEHTVTVAVGASIAALEYTVGHLITGGGSIDWSLAYVTVFVRIGWLRQAHNMVTASLNEMNEQPTVWPSTMAELAPAAGNSIAYSVGFVATEYAGQISAILRRIRDGTAAAPELYTETLANCLLLYFVLMGKCGGVVTDTLAISNMEIAARTSLAALLPAHIGLVGLWVLPALRQFHAVNTWSDRDAFTSLDAMRHMVDALDELEGTGEDDAAGKVALLMHQYSGFCSVFSRVNVTTLNEVVAVFRRVYSPNAIEYLIGDGDSGDDDDARTLLVSEDDERELSDGEYQWRRDGWLTD